MERKTLPKVTQYEHYPRQFNAKTVRAVYMSIFERSQTRLRMQHPIVQSLRTH